MGREFRNDGGKAIMKILVTGGAGFIGTHLVRRLVHEGCSVAVVDNFNPQVHAGVEELYLLHGELWIDEKKLYPGDYNHAEAGTADQRVWSETGCTCILLTSTRDVLR